ncbi:MAG: hypothetical protein P1Q69_07015 [Candidatus Thorarchaeota archaeon]|nr:hypothetical protein [Candidatus Thorarchaeota archaeon]
MNDNPLLKFISTASNIDQRTLYIDVTATDDIEQCPRCHNGVRLLSSGYWSIENASEQREMAAYCGLITTHIPLVFSMAEYLCDNCGHTVFLVHHIFSEEQIEKIYRN